MRGYRTRRTSSNVVGACIMLFCLTAAISALVGMSFPSVAFAFSGGDGSEANPYRVATANDLDAVRNDLDAHYLQVADIDLSGWEWEPIAAGNRTNVEAAFEGSYDGDRHTISNLSITRCTSESEYLPPSFGLFGICERDSVIQSVRLSNVNIDVDLSPYIGDYSLSYNVHTGGIAAYSAGTIADCSVSGSIRITAVLGGYIGGIVGMGNASGSTNRASITVSAAEDNDYSSTICCGGIAGHSYTVNGSIQRCANYGNVIASSDDFLHCGGICGEDGALDSCVNFGDVTGSVLSPGYTSSFAVNANVGGIVGSTSSDTLNRCVNHGSISATTGKETRFTEVSAGGIAGWIGYYNSGSISSCYNLGESITSTNHVGRIAGRLIENKSTGNYSLDVTCVNGLIPPANETGESTIHGGTMSRSQIEAAVKSIVNDVTDNGSTGDDDTTIIPGQATHYYGATQENTPEAEIQELSKKFVSAMDDYFAAVQKAASQDMNRAGSGGAVDKAQILKDLDAKSQTPMLSFGDDGTDIASGARDAAYTVLAEYFDEYIDQGVKDNKIDMSASTIEISASIVNKVRDSFQFDSYTRHVGQYTVKFNITILGWGPLRSYMGRVNVYKGLTNYAGIIVSDPDTTAATLESYVNTLADWTKDALYEAVSSLAMDLTKVTGIADFAEREMKDMIEDRVASLQRRGFGDLLRYWLTVRDAYDIVEPIVTARDSDELKDVLKKAERIKDKLAELDFTDSGVTNRTVKNAMTTLRSAWDNLDNALFDYISDGNVETTWWDDFLSCFVQCPVDVTVTDSSGAVLGSVVDGEVTCSDAIDIEVIGDAKHITVPSDIQPRFKLEGTDSGSMTFVVEQVAGGAPSGRVVFNAQLKDGRVYTYKPPSGTLSETDMGSLDNNDWAMTIQTYFSSEDANASVDVTASSVGNGTVMGSGAYPKGDPVILQAYPANEETVFDGWYLDGELVSISSKCQFPATRDIDLEARFSSVRVVDEDVKITVANAFVDVLDAYAYRASGNLDDLVLSIAGAEGIDEPTSLVIKSFDDQGVLLKETKVNTVRDGSFRFEAQGLDLKSPARVEVYAADGSLILTVGTDGSGEQVVGERTMYRLYNPNTGEHFYTATEEERDDLSRVGWTYEGIGWIAPTTGAPVYRLYNPNAPGGDHHYTGSKEERDNLVSVGWRYEGIGWYSGGPVKIYRQYNPNASSGTHNYTASLEENDMLVSLGWRYEGIGWDALRAR